MINAKEAHKCSTVNLINSMETNIWKNVNDFISKVCDPAIFEAVKDGKYAVHVRFFNVDIANYVQNVLHENGYRTVITWGYDAGITIMW
jgi:hypothetical protein